MGANARLSGVAALGALALLAAGCGGKAQPGATATTTPQRGYAAFASCMRSHGVPGWPDPGGDGQFDKSKLRALGIPPARMQRLQQPCLPLLPASAAPPTPQQVQTRVADALSFARCMRSHGVGRFPDPNAQGSLSIAMVQAQGIDIHAPAVLRVVSRCLPASHGALTPAMVQHALGESHS